MISKAWKERVCIGGVGTLQPFGDGAVQLPPLVSTFFNDSPLGMEMTALALKVESGPLFVTDKAEEKGIPKGAFCGVVWKRGSRSACSMLMKVIQEAPVTTG